MVTSTAPEACLAMRPVSNTRRLPPASSTATSVLVDIKSSFRFSLGKLGIDSAVGRHTLRFETARLEKPGRNAHLKMRRVRAQLRSRRHLRKLGADLSP